MTRPIPAIPAPIGQVLDGARDLWPRCHAAAVHEGLSAAVALLHRAVCPGVLPCGPGTHAVVPTAVERTCDRVWVDGVELDRRSCREEPLATLQVGGETIVALRCRPAPGSAGGHRPSSPATWRLGLAWLRLGLSERLLGECAEHLGRRMSGGNPLLHQQMVRGMVADALIEQLEARAVLEDVVADDRQRHLLAELHQQITTADRILLRLLGASGFLAGGPGQTTYVSELLADAYGGRPARGELE